MLECNVYSVAAEELLRTKLYDRIYLIVFQFSYCELSIFIMHQQSSSNCMLRIDLLVDTIFKSLCFVLIFS